MSQTKDVDAYIAEQQAKLQDNPQCANTYYNLGLGLLSKRMFKEAEEAFLKAVDCSPKLVEAYVQLGGIAMQRGDIASCKHYNEVAAKTMPLFAVPFANLGFCHLQVGEADKAIQYFQKAVKKDPKYVQAIASLGGAYYMTGDLEAAEHWCTKALGIAPEFGPALNNLALVYLERKDYPKAVEYLEKAIATGFEPPEGLIEELAPYRATQD